MKESLYREQFQPAYRGVIYTCIDNDYQVQARKLIREGIHIVFPRIRNMKKRIAEVKMNEAVRKSTYELLFLARNHFPYCPITGNFSIHYSSQDLLSLSMEHIMHPAAAEEGYRWTRYITANTQTGEVYYLRRLFNTQKKYLHELNSRLLVQGRDDSMPVDPISGIYPFYITAEALCLPLHPQDAFSAPSQLLEIPLVELGSLLDPSTPVYSIASMDISKAGE